MYVCESLCPEATTVKTPPCAHIPHAYPSLVLSHYKYPPADIPAALIKGGADVEATDGKGLTALQVRAALYSLNFVLVTLSLPYFLT